MPEEPLEGEPAEHEPEEIEDADAVPEDIVLRRKEKVKSRGSPPPGQRHSPMHALKEELQRIEDAIAPRRAAARDTAGAVREEDAVAQAQRDVARVEEALRTEAHREAAELKERAAKLKATIVRIGQAKKRA